MSSFFSRPPCDLETLRLNVYYVVRQGEGGFTYRDVMDMTFDELQWHVKKISDDIKERNEQQRRAADEAKRKNRRKR